MRRTDTIFCLLMLFAFLPAALPARAQAISGGADSPAAPAAFLPVISFQSNDLTPYRPGPPVAFLPLISIYTPPPTPPPDWIAATGSIVCLAADPYNPRVLYAGTWGGGVFRSEDQGSTWTWASSGMSNYLINSLVVDPLDSSILYAGTHAGGLFKSEDRGQNWHSADNGIQPDAAIYTLAVSPSDHQVLYAGTRKTGTGIDLPYNGILYKSVNGGGSWYPVLTDVGGAGIKDWVYSVAIKTSPNLVLVATHEHGPFISNTGESGSWRSVPVQGLYEYTKGRAVAFDPRPGSTTAFYATWHGGFYLSTNSGGSFGLVNQGFDDAKIYPNGIVFASGRPDIMFLASMDTDKGVLKSTDSGRAWYISGLTGDPIYTILAPSDGDVLLAGTAGDGLYKSTDGGRSWNPSISGLQIHPAEADLTASAAPTPLPPEPMQELLAEDDSP